MENSAGRTDAFQSFDIFAGFEVDLSDPVKYEAGDRDRRQEDRIDHASHY